MNTSVSPITEPTFAFVALRQDEGWTLQNLGSEVLTDLDTVIAAIRNYRIEGASVGFISIDDDWSAIIRPVPGGVELFMGDAAVALDDPLAAEILDRLNADIPDEEEVDESDEPFPEGNFDILSDLGVLEDQLSVLFDDPELYASEQIARLAEDLGFGQQFEHLVDLV